jgi:phosphoglucomutase
MKGYQEKYEEWCNNPIFDEETKAELEKMKDNEAEKEDSFYKDLEFGTAGLRGVVGIGTNRMNKYTVGKASQGLAKYIVKMGGQKRGVAIAYDSRHMSTEFSELAALILNANGIKTYIFESLRPTPELSFAVRKLGCISGIVVTASHNPPKYNGYKVYWEDGAQISEPIDGEIIAEVNSTDFADIKKISKEEAIEKGLYNVIGPDFDDLYINELKKNTLNPEAIKEAADSLKIVYTPLHGTGGRLAKKLFNELGYKNVHIVKEQEEPNGDFPTVSYPNPEDPKAFEYALKLAKEVDADIVLANDPDADRIGLQVKDPKTGEYIVFNGNMIGLTIAEYLISQKREKGIMPENPALIKTIVSSNMTDRICEYYGVELFLALTGFKNIAARIRQFEKTNSNNCIMGFEESYGCLIGTHARDKDGIIAVMMLCEIAAYYKLQGLTLWDAIEQMYERYGYYREGQIPVTLEGADGAAKIQEMMKTMRNNPPETIGKYKVLKIMDCSAGTEKDILTGEEVKIDLPKSNVLRYSLENDCWCAVRPSGTEPKIKFYMGVRGDSLEGAEKDLADLTEAMRAYTK